MYVKNSILWYCILCIVYMSRILSKILSVVKKKWQCPSAMPFRHAIYMYNKLKQIVGAKSTLMHQQDCCTVSKWLVRCSVSQSVSQWVSQFVGDLFTSVNVCLCVCVCHKHWSQQIFKYTLHVRNTMKCDILWACMFIQNVNTYTPIGTWKGERVRNETERHQWSILCK